MTVDSEGLRNFSGGYKTSALWNLVNWVADKITHDMLYYSTRKRQNTILILKTSRSNQYVQITRKRVHGQG